MILVSSHPKSGASWFQFLVYCCYNGAYKSSKEVLRFYPPNNRSTLIAKSKANPLFVKSHNPYHSDMDYHDQIDKCIILVRHPLNVMMSLVNHHKNQGSARMLFKVGRRAFYNKFLEDNKAAKLRSWNQHTNSWISQNQFETHFIKYEDLLDDPYQSLASLSTNYNLGWSKENITAAITLCSIQNLKALESHELDNKIAGLFYSKRRSLTKKIFNTQFINKGKKSNYKNVVSEDFIAKAKDTFEENLAHLSYSI